MSASTPKSPTPQNTKVESVSPPTGNKRSKMIILMMTGLIVILLAVGSIMAWLLLRNQDSNDEEDEDQETQEETSDDEEDDSQDESEQTGDDEQQEDTTEETEEPDMTEGWSEYYNSTWDFGFKYPVDITYTEIVTDPATNEIDILFKGGGSIDVFAVWVRTSGTLDNMLSNMTANACTNDAQYSNVSFSGVNYRKIKDIPDQDCLDFYGTTRDIDLVAFGRQITAGGYIFGIRNEKLNNSQLEALMGTVYNN
ncbi:hypothetical protein JW710_01025 [Candidatus Dojkabacteria bacterium]|nr:hypothetical protein [Candidatus Dojkabacteria bacterium]